MSMTALAGRLPTKWLACVSLGDAVAAVRHAKVGAVLVDAHDGPAFPASNWRSPEAIQCAREFGVSFAGVTNSHHCGVLVDHLRPAGGALAPPGLDPAQTAEYPKAGAAIRYVVRFPPRGLTEVMGAAHLIAQ